MKASDIPDNVFLEIVREFNEGRAPDEHFPERVAWPGTSIEFVIPAWTLTGGRWATVWDMEERLGAPTKIVLAKARSLIRRGLMDGCACGCRGDFEVVPLVNQMPFEDTVPGKVMARS